MNGMDSVLRQNGVGGNASSESGVSNSANEEGRTNLIINYLPQVMSQGELTTLFQSAGDIASCKLCRDKDTGISLGYGFVNYRKPEDAESAIKTFNGMKILNKTIKVSYARPSSEAIKGANLYVSGLPPNITLNELEEMFGRYGRIINSRLLMDENKAWKAANGGDNNGVGFIRFDQRMEAERAIEALNGTIPEGSTTPIQVKFAADPTKKLSANFMQQIPRRIYPAAAVAAAARINTGKSVLPINKGLQRFSPLMSATDPHHPHHHHHQYHPVGTVSYFANYKGSYRN
ncbi:hypothetical protein O3M35_003167 [Rhynocoris fuscipes]|uniref:RRM domain-containing protein n=1 Tax=Rhynocoris fuscipes TaxID=488301 RepID=A0AAW1CM52_9HEMI